MEKLVPFVYGELHRLARRYIAAARPAICNTAAPLYSKG
jgi:hypothetical protein